MREVNTSRVHRKIFLRGAPVPHLRDKAWRCQAARRRCCTNASCDPHPHV
jgi:hypothetical protein